MAVRSSHIIIILLLYYYSLFQPNWVLQQFKGYELQKICIYVNIKNGAIMARVHETYLVSVSITNGLKFIAVHIYVSEIIAHGSYN